MIITYIIKTYNHDISTIPYQPYQHPVQHPIIYAERLGGKTARSPALKVEHCACELHEQKQVLLYYQPKHGTIKGKSLKTPIHLHQV